MGYSNGGRREERCSAAGIAPRFGRPLPCKDGKRTVRPACRRVKEVCCSLEGNLAGDGDADDAVSHVLCEIGYQVIKRQPE